jgi:hypothetical protein
VELGKGPSSCSQTQTAIHTHTTSRLQAQPFISRQRCMAYLSKRHKHEPATKRWGDSFDSWRDKLREILQFWVRFVVDKNHSHGNLGCINVIAYAPTVIRNESPPIGFRPLNDLCTGHTRQPAVPASIPAIHVRASYPTPLNTVRLPYLIVDQMAKLPSDSGLNRTNITFATSSFGKPSTELSSK